MRRAPKAALALGVGASFLAAGSYASFRLAFGREAKNPLHFLERKRGPAPWEVYREKFRYAGEELKALPHEDVSITSFDGLRLHGRFWPAGENAKRTVLCVHGYRSGSLWDFALAALYFLDLGCNLLLIDQRSQGESEGQYITFGVHESRDCRDWACWLEERFGKDHPIYLDGVSMGAATVLLSVQHGLPESVKGIIADCGYTQPWEMLDCALRRNFEVPGAVVRPLLRVVDVWCRALGKFSLYGTDTTEAVRQAKMPILFAHGVKDSLVPYTMSVRNYEASSGGGELFLVDEADHGISFLIAPKAYRERLEKLFGCWEPAAGEKGPHTIEA